MKKLLILIIFIFLINIVIAQHTTTITTNPSQSYETSLLEINISITNNAGGGSRPIINTTIFPSNYTILDIPNSTEFIIYTNTSDIIICSASFNPSQTQHFGTFTFQTPLVNNDTTYNWTIQTEDDINDTYNNSILITALNDPTPPTFSNILPENASLTQDLESKLFSINTQDEQTGIKQAILYYCNNESIQKCNSSTSIKLNCTNNICNTTLNLSNYQDSSYINYEFNITNNANETNSSDWLYIQIDKIPPSITLESPNNGIEVNQNDNLTFEFKATDNLATNLNCSLIINNLIIKTKTVSNNISNNFTHTITESGDWKINCTDEVVLENSSETRSFSFPSPPPPTESSDSSTGGTRTINKPSKPEKPKTTIPPPAKKTEYKETQEIITQTSPSFTGRAIEIGKILTTGKVNITLIYILAILIPMYVTITVIQRRRKHQFYV